MVRLALSITTNSILFAFAKDINISYNASNLIRSALVMESVGILELAEMFSPRFCKKSFAE